VLHGQEHGYGLAIAYLVAVATLVALAITGTGLRSPAACELDIHTAGTTFNKARPIERTDGVRGQHWVQSSSGSDGL
jgi:hypothetical protein